MLAALDTTGFSFSKFYFVDWSSMVLQFASIYALGCKWRIGFVIAIGGSVCWLIFGCMTGSIADILANTLFVFMNAIGFWRWGR